MTQASTNDLREKVKQKRLAVLLRKHQEGKTSAAETKELDALLAAREEKETVGVSSGWLCSNAQLCALFKVSRETISSWTKKGMPKESHGTYDFQKVFPWWMENINTGPEDQDETITEAKRKYWVQKAKREEIRNEIQLENLLPCDKVYPEWSQRAADLKQSLLAFASRLSPILENKSADDIRITIRNEVLKTLETYCRDSVFCPQKKPIEKKMKKVKKTK